MSQYKAAMDRIFNASSPDSAREAETTTQAAAAPQGPQTPLPTSTVKSNSTASDNEEGMLVVSSALASGIELGLIPNPEVKVASISPLSAKFSETIEDTDSESENIAPTCSWEWGLDKVALAVHRLRESSPTLIDFVLPVVWVMLFLDVMDGESLQQTMLIPLACLFSTMFTYLVPLGEGGGGTLYLPLLYILLGMPKAINDCVTCVLATAAVGAGLVDFLLWLERDPGLIMWEAMMWAVLPSWAGTLLAAVWARANPHLTSRSFQLAHDLLRSPSVAKGVLAGYYLVSAVWTIYWATSRSSSDDDSEDLQFNSATINNSNIYTYTVPGSAIESPGQGLLQRGISRVTARVLLANIRTPWDWSAEHLVLGTHRYRNPYHDGLNAPSVVPHTRLHIPHVCRWRLAAVSLASSAVLVPYIGLGPALTTYFCLERDGFDPQPALVTAAIAGGWACILPALLRGIGVIDSSAGGGSLVPVGTVVLMGLPGAYLGAKYAHVIFAKIGLSTHRRLLALGAAQMAAALLFITAAMLTSQK